MIARGFKSVGWVAAVGAAALGCYMLSLQVATERADLARVERQIVSTKQQIRSLQTELGTRGRLSQLEQWNNDVLALAAPASGQYLQDEFTLARLETHDSTVADNAPVRMASAEQPAPGAPAAPAKPAIAAPAVPASAVQPTLVHQASFTAPDPRAASPVARRTESKPVVDAAKPAKAPAAVATRTAEPPASTRARPNIARTAAPTPQTVRAKAAAADTSRAPATRQSSARTEIARADAAPAVRAPASRPAAPRPEASKPARSTSRSAPDAVTTGRSASAAGGAGRK